MTKHRHIYRQKRTAVFILLAAVLICAAVCEEAAGRKPSRNGKRDLQRMSCGLTLPYIWNLGFETNFCAPFTAASFPVNCCFPRAPETQSFPPGAPTARRNASQTPPRWSIRSFRRAEKARYIRVQIGKQGFASIFEIEVYGRE